jgi:hypothetical protein
MDSFYEKNLGKGYETSILFVSYVAALPLINVLDKKVFPAHKINSLNKAYKMEISQAL